MASSEKVKDSAMENMAAAETVAAPAVPEPKRYIATENCFFNGQYLKRGEIILLPEKPDHASLEEYTEKKTVKETGSFYDPITGIITERRIKAAMPAFIK